MVMHSFHQVALFLFFQDRGHMCVGPVLSVSDASWSGLPEHCGYQVVGDRLGLLDGVESCSNFGIRYGLRFREGRTTWRFRMGEALSK